VRVKMKIGNVKTEKQANKQGVQWGNHIGVRREGGAGS